MTEAILKGLGISVCGDLYEKRGLVKICFSELNWKWLLRVALGIAGD